MLLYSNPYLAHLCRAWVSRLWAHPPLPECLAAQAWEPALVTVQVRGCEESGLSSAEQPSWGSHLLTWELCLSWGFWPWSLCDLCRSHACVLADLDPVPDLILCLELGPVWWSGLGQTWFPSLDLLCLPCSGVVELPFCLWNLCGCLPCFHREFPAQLTLLKQHLTWLLSHTREVKGSYQLQIVNEVGKANLKETIDFPVDCREPVDSLC